ncbi:hypothetical protein B296_00022238 [Ensete ventricosum]|uniref:Uncharacterized protein n=1 Tax=Ensete ventricosum TaxID=4639 RepID=A0A426Z3W3_ENSVE|nr:hypothetical protein B296_00022238 [Ensete ventricosum]
MDGGIGKTNPTAEVTGGKRHEQQELSDQRDVRAPCCRVPRGLATALPTQQLWAHDGSCRGVGSVGTTSPRGRRHRDGGDGEPL